MPYNLDKFEAGLRELSLELTDQQKQQFIRYYEMMVEKNKVMNLTAITEFDEVIENISGQSLSDPCMGLYGKCQILDLGTGAGFPGIPLKIAFPELEIVLMGFFK